MPTPSLQNCLKTNRVEAGCDEAGRGALAGPVVAAAVILPQDFYHPLLNDSKQLTADKREKLAVIIKSSALAYAYGIMSHRVIERINVLQASLRAMDHAVKKLQVQPQHLLIDGPHYLKNSTIPYDCIKKGDSLYTPIAAASILAKTLRDDLMEQLDLWYPEYNWRENKGYGTPTHTKALQSQGHSPYHRRTYKTVQEVMQLKLFG